VSALTAMATYFLKSSLQFLLNGHTTIYFSGKISYGCGSGLVDSTETIGFFKFIFKLI